MPELSQITDSLIGQPMFNLLAKANEMERDGKEIIHLEIGDPGFSSSPQAVEALKSALDSGLTHYTNSMGIPEFRNAVCDYTEKHWGFRPSVDQVLECPANAIIDFTIRCVANPGDEIIYPEPGFPTYHSVIKYNGMIPVGVKLKEENNFRMDPEDVYTSITSKTKLIIINSPNNPTGAVMTEKEIKYIAHIAEHNDIYILSDEVYSRIIYDKTHYSPALSDFCKERTIILNSLSKMFAMSGWRLGYAVGPKDLIGKMGLLLQTIISCQPAFTQLGGVAILKDNAEFVAHMTKMLREQRDTLINGINRIPKLSCIMPDGAFYAFVNIRDMNMTSDEFSEKLLQETGVCVLPGSCFGEAGEGYVRLCYASATVDTIKKALNKIRGFIS